MTFSYLQKLLASNPYLLGPFEKSELQECFSQVRGRLWLILVYCEAST
jgi:YesN/AraC family two-component response regulator